ncbi:MAG TPA: signal peptide peptidase SppA [Thermodesulfovibrionales bacterium]|nr:signal peptide peptidase SppA [Thermodesulfovibrionales bacterium]
MKRNALLFVLSLLVLSGCAVSLLPETKPLDEKVLEGDGKQKILLVDLDGVISFKEERDSLLHGTRPSKVASFREALLKAEADPDIAGVIVRVNSPGGTVSASDTIYHEIMSFRERRKIPVTAFIMELGASGGYYVAAASDRIVASPTAITGSIGVVAMKFNVEGLLSKIGVSEETFKSGAKKDFWSPFRPTTAEEKKMFQDIIDKLYARFVEVVYANRQKLLTEQEVRVLADGRIFTAGEAFDARLIDQVAYLDETINGMKTALNIEHARVITYVRPKAFKSTIYSETPPSGPQVVNLISINAEDFPVPSGTQFMYLWNP